MPTPPEYELKREAPLSLVSLARRSWIYPPPTPLNPIIGRQRERASAADLIHDGARLVTLTGSAGMGKTRLALQLAIDLTDTFVDGVAWVPMAAVREVDRVIPATAKALRIESSPNTPPLQALAIALRDAQLLLILDNLEQVLEAGEQIAALLATCPGLVIVTTSRSPLRVSGEHVVNVQPLDLPEPGPRSATYSDEMTPTESERLFIDRARAIAPEFAVDETSVPIVSDICRHLEGVPLAIELAAARVSYLPLPALWSRLERRLPLLAGGTRDQPSRHRTMRDAIAWSHDLLSANEQAVFRGLAVYTGGFRLDAVAALQAQQPGDTAHAATTGTLPPEQPDPSGMASEPLDHIATLVDHSLLQRTVDPDGEPRFTMLETIREFALEQLEASGEWESAAHARAAYLVTLAERLELAPLLAGSEVSLAIVELEQANIRETLSWLIETGDLKAALRLASALAFAWIAMGHYAEGQLWLEPLLSSKHLGNAPERGQALVGLGLIFAYQDDPPRAETAFAEALNLPHTQQYPLHKAMALIGLGGAKAELEGSAEVATGPLNEALTLAGELADPRLAAFVASMAHETLGATANVHGQLSAARTHHRAALALRREAGFTLGVCISLSNLCDVARNQGDLQRSLAYCREFLTLATEHWSPPFIVGALTAAADIAMAWDQPEVAARLLGAVEALRTTIGFASSGQPDRPVPDGLHANVHAALGDAAVESARLAGGALSLSDAIAEVDRITPPADEAATPSAAAMRYGLTPRETEILRGIAELLTDREIAERLFISRRTVSWHVTSILAKLGVDSRRAAAIRADEEDIV